MNKRQQVVVRILLLVAKMFADAEWKKDIEQLSSHISVNVKDDDK